MQEHDLVIVIEDIHNGHGAVAIRKGTICEIAHIYNTKHAENFGGEFMLRCVRPTLAPRRGLHGVNPHKVKLLTEAAKVLYGKST